MNVREKWEAGQWSLAITTCWNPTIIEIYWIERPSRATTATNWNVHWAPTDCKASGMHKVTMPWRVAPFITSTAAAPPKIEKKFQQVINNFWRGSSCRIISIINQTFLSLLALNLQLDFYNQWKQLLLIIGVLKEQHMNNKSVFLNFFNFTLRIAS